MLFILWFLLYACTTGASERILLFHSDITVHPDARLTVQETIQVKSTHTTIKHGIVREFPTEYKNEWGNTYTVHFTIDDIQRDGHSEPYHIEDAFNGKKIYIGSADIWLNPGIYTYTIRYTTNRQLGFFKEHDELYWNVTGNGWRLPIDAASATVHLPSSIPRNAITVEAYTGYQASKEQEYTASINEKGDIIIVATTPLLQYEGLTAVVTWPKGYIREPSWWQQWWWFLQDNLSLCIAICGCIALLGWYIVAWLRVRAKQHIATIIPLFYPPEGMTPGLVRYFMRMGYDAKVLAADIVDMAVHGLVRIEHVRSRLWSQAEYILHAVDEDNKTAKVPAAHETYYRSLRTRFTLVNNGDAIALSTKNRHVIESVIDHEKQTYASRCYSYFQLPGWEIFYGVLISLLFFVALVMTIDASTTYIVILAAVVYVLLHAWFFHLLKGYSREGLSIKQAIEGFKMFLATTEQERIAMIGTPPTKTPELYEKYLPYAIALGVEKAWSAQFAPLFEEMQRAGHPYVCVWYSGRDIGSFNPTSFTTAVGNSIAAASTPPGKSSGSGGSGSSGGGGGGGGGGGW